MTDFQRMIPCIHRTKQVNTSWFWIKKRTRNDLVTALVRSPVNNETDQFSLYFPALAFNYTSTQRLLPSTCTIYSWVEKFLAL